MIFGRQLSPWRSAGPISFFGSTNSATSSISMPGGIQSGDIGIIFDGAIDTGATPPSSVTPSGFTQIGTSQTSTFLTFSSMRWNMWYKVLDGTETSLTGMSAAAMYKTSAVMRKTGGTWGSPSSIGNECVVTGGVTAKTVTVGSSPLFVMGGVTEQNVSFTPSAQGTFGPGGGTGVNGGYIIYNTGASNVDVSSANLSATEAIGAFYVALTP